LQRLRELADHAAELAGALQPCIATQLHSAGDGSRLRRLAVAVGQATGRELSDADFSDQYAQSLICGTASLVLAGDVFRDLNTRRWLETSANPMWRSVLQECLSLYVRPEYGDKVYGWDANRWRNLHAALEAFAAEHGPPHGGQQAFYFLEVFLQRRDARHRKRHGIFYTPRPIAQYIIADTHRALRDTFRLPDGLADTTTWGQLAERFANWPLPRGVNADEPFVRILDPATGSGVFLAEAIRLVHRHLRDRWSQLPPEETDIPLLWDEFVADTLLPRLYGLELLLTACVVANITLTQTLAETGFRFTRSANLELHLANTLAGPAGNPAVAQHNGQDWSGQTAVGSRHSARRTPFTAIVGNPPFSGVSRDENTWIVELLRGRERGGRRWADYYQVDGQPLGERKTWLQDDYVKFLRFAHWLVESAGCGVVGYVTNHGYLDNPTFRGLRYQLLQTFSQLDVLDLHGNRKKGEQPPDGGRDENVFGIDQGTAIGVFCRPPAAAGEATVRHGQLWGDAVQKLATLQAAAAAEPAGSTALGSWRTITPGPPLYAFVPRDARADAEYARGLRLPDAMPRYVSAPVTARDRFVVAFSRSELLQRIQEFRDLSIPDAEIRRRYFTRTRSPRYAAGDTRGWQLALARRLVADDPDWQDRVEPCWYRPFDRRVIYWAPWMIDWPREDIMQYLRQPGNLALVARRQMLPTQPRNFFWITDALPLDGLIRSDNRGSEYIFPLFLDSLAPSGDGPRHVNFAEPTIRAVAKATAWQWTSGSAGDLQTTFGPLDLVHYLYALFFASAYRTRYAEGLLRDFPRLFVPRRPDVFAELSRLGRRLAAAHLLRGDDQPAGPATDVDPAWTLDERPELAPGFPKYRGNRVCVNNHVWLDGVAPEVWSFTVGGHQVCRKWLRDRQGRHLCSAELQTYRRIVRAVEETARCAQTIDALLERQGSWPQAFGLA
jgi:predicted helicase